MFRREKDGVRRVLSMDALLAHLGAWDRTANRRFAERRALPATELAADRRSVERRDEKVILAEQRRAVDARAEADVPLIAVPGALVPPVKKRISLPERKLDEPRP